MREKTTEKNRVFYAVCSAALIAVYTLLRSLFGGDFAMNEDIPFGNEKTDFVFFVLFGFVFLLCVSAVVLIPSKGLSSLPVGLLPFVLISGLGECRFSMSYGEKSFDWSLVYGIMLLTLILIKATGFHFIGIASVVAVYFVGGLYVPASAPFIIALTLPYLFSPDEKKSRAALLSLALQVFAAVVTTIIAFRGVSVSPESFDLQNTVFSLLFMLPVAVLSVFRASKSRKAADIAEYAVLCVAPAVTLAATALTGGAFLEPRQGLVSAAAMTVLLFCYYSSRKDSPVKNDADRLTAAKPLYFLLLAFVARLCGFLYLIF